MKIEYEEYGDTKTENIDKYGDVIIKMKDCKKITQTENHEVWIHVTSNKKLYVPIDITRHWEQAREK